LAALTTYASSVQRRHEGLALALVVEPVEVPFFDDLV
jgi:hypothetical protein